MRKIFDSVATVVIVVSLAAIGIETNSLVYHARAKTAAVTGTTGIWPTLPPKLAEHLHIKGELGQGCEFALLPPGSGVVRTITNLGPVDSSGNILLGVADNDRPTVSFGVADSDEELPYWQWDFHFYAAAGRLYVLEPKEGAKTFGYFLGCIAPGQLL